MTRIGNQQCWLHKSYFKYHLIIPLHILVNLFQLLLILKFLLSFPLFHQAPKKFEFVNQLDHKVSPPIQGISELLLVVHNKVVEGRVTQPHRVKLKRVRCQNGVEIKLKKDSLMV